MLKKYDIFINIQELGELKDRWRNKPREFTRRLMRLIVGPNQLARMTANGWGGTPRILKKTYRAVLRYVNKKCQIPEKHLTRKEYRRILTNMCNGLRYRKQEQ
ncbi:hypothetical protein QAD02_002362 [Eretmocerus hayati]|uniref:Uncharacterized protein n=1 Tax=Eretmocerus hayati TaxID=131215 RepID=A0ACC2NJW2_9HYME|nr:hypothetical protein QAD02_002362 [Eretmocerus hayati]